MRQARHALALFSWVLSACASTGPAHPNVASAARYALVPTYDRGMNHVGVVVVLAESSRPAQALVLGRFLASCRPEAYAALVEAPAPSGTLFAFGCPAVPEIDASSRGVVARVVRRGGWLVGEWAVVEPAEPPRFVEAGAMSLPHEAIVELDADAGDRFVDAMDGLPTVHTCHAYPESCAP